MRTIILNGGDMGGRSLETDAAIGASISVVSDAGYTVGQTLHYRIEADGTATYLGVA